MGGTRECLVAVEGGKLVDEIVSGEIFLGRGMFWCEEYIWLEVNVNV